MTVKEGPRQPETAEYPIPPWQAQARSVETVKAVVLWHYSVTALEDFNAVLSCHCAAAMVRI